MRTVQDILYAVTGQTLVCDAPEGRPSSVTSVKVFRYSQNDDETPEFAPTGTVETDPNTTTDAAAGSDQTDTRNVPLTATTGVTLGRSYLLTSSTFEKEWVEVLEIAAADTVTARHPLHNTYATGSTFQSTRITAPVDATWVADLSNMLEAGPDPMYRVRWVYVVSGVTYVQDTYCNLVRYAGRHGLSPVDIDATLPGWLDSLPTDYRKDQGRRLIDEAYRTVKIDMHQISLDDSTIAESEVVDDLVRYKTIELGEWQRVLAGSQDAQRYDLAAKTYQTRLDALIRLTTKVPVRDASGAARRDRPTIGLTRR